MATKSTNSSSASLGGTAAGTEAPIFVFGTVGNPLIDSDQAAALASVDKRRWSAQLLKQLEWRRFEELCVAHFQARGYKASVAPSGSHAGVDIHLTAQGAEQASLVLQCKPWDAHRVGIN